jgi:hypothetical protein
VSAVAFVAAGPHAIVTDSAYTRPTQVAGADPDRATSGPDVLSVSTAVDTCQLATGLRASRSLPDLVGRGPPERAFPRLDPMLGPKLLGRFTGRVLHARDEPADG